MSRICLCLTGKTLAKNMELIEKYRAHIDLAELRVDCLDADERFCIRRFPEMAGMPVILTIRRESDGGKYSGGEGSRVILFSKGLAFADVDRRKNFAYVDIEANLDVPSLEEAARTFGTRIIRSHYNYRDLDEDIPARLKSLPRAGDEIAKAVYMPRSLADSIRLYRAARETEGMDKILAADGNFSLHTRVLAELLGSYLSYTRAKEDPAGGSPAGEPDTETQAGPDPKELDQHYRFRKISKKTKIYGIVGNPLHSILEPSFYNSLFTQEKEDAVYIPFPAESLAAFLNLADEIKLEGAAVTFPYKEEIIPHLVNNSSRVELTRACNTIIRGTRGWIGYNTDVMGFSDSFLDFVGKKSLFARRLTIIGAGSAARAAAAEIHRLKGRALVLNRTAFRAMQLARKFGFAWGGLDYQGQMNVSRYSHIIIQATSAGAEPDTASDPLELYSFSGSELVMDLNHKPEKTKFLARASAAGCKTLNGHTMLIQQAKYQYNLFTGRALDNEVIAKKF